MICSNPTATFISICLSWLPTVSAIFRTNESRWTSLWIMPSSLLSLPTWNTSDAKPKAVRLEASLYLYSLCYSCIFLFVALFTDNKLRIFSHFHILLNLYFYIQTQYKHFFRSKTTSEERTIVFNLSKIRMIIMLMDCSTNSRRYNNSVRTSPYTRRRSASDGSCPAFRNSPNNVGVCSEWCTVEDTSVPGRELERLLFSKQIILLNFDKTWK